MRCSESVQFMKAKSGRGTRAILSDWLCRSVAIQPSQWRTQLLSASLPDRPCHVQANGCPAFVAFVA